MDKAKNLCSEQGLDHPSPINGSGLTPNLSRALRQEKPVDPKLLAVDCGLRTGLAVFDRCGKLVWYRSHNLGSRARLKRAIWQILNSIDDLSCLVIEGGGSLAEMWVKEGAKRGLKLVRVEAELWRQDILLPRQRRSGRQAKQEADSLARELIAQSDAARPSSLQDHAAEAILIGWWACRTEQCGDFEPVQQRAALAPPGPSKRQY